MILALDPGPTETGWVLYIPGDEIRSGVAPNAEILAYLKLRHADDCRLAIEMIASYHEREWA